MCMCIVVVFLFIIVIIIIVILTIMLVGELVSISRWIYARGASIRGANWLRR